MKKTYETPILQLHPFDVQDVLTASDVPQQSPLSNAIHTMFELAAGKASQMVNGPFDG